MIYGNQSSAEDTDSLMPDKHILPKEIAYYLRLAS
jgi:hypothetical protein